MRLTAKRLRAILRSMTQPAYKEEAFRQTPEPKDNARDSRSEFERDRARIIHSAAFRRLQGKTQVFGVYEGDFFRTRLTHSLEVAQIAKGIALNLGADTDLVEAICLAHDLGHPPFGHNGEQVLHYLMREHGGFEGNAQTFRILTRLERKNNAYEGLNLTYQTLDGVLKYKKPIEVEAAHTTQDKLDRPDTLNKPIKGFYGWDREFIEEVITRTGTGWQRSFECQIMDMADDIAYSVHDLEDSLKAGLIRTEDFHKFSSLKIHRAVNARLATTIVGQEVDEEDIHTELVGIANRLEQLERQAGRAARKMITRSLIHAFASSVDVQANGWIEAEMVSRTRIEILKAFVSHVVIFNPRVTTLGHKGREIIRRLFATLDRGKESIGLFPEDYGEAYEKALMSGTESDRKRVVCDFLAGMTDSYAMRFYGRLFVPGEGSFYEML